MEVAVTVRCSKDYGHSKLSKKNKRCHECEAPLEKLCSSCDAFVNYSNAAKHLKKCRMDASEGMSDGVEREDDDGADEDEENEEDERAVRVAYLAAVWEEGIPMGQYLGALHDGFPANLEQRVVNDPTGDAMRGVDAYDAIWGTLFASDTRFRLVHTFRTLNEVKLAVTHEQDVLKEVDVVVLGNWIHPLCARDEATGRSIAERFLNTLASLETDRRVRVFPPLDYVWHFSRKVHYYSHFSQYPLPKYAFAIPSIAVPDGHMWKKKVREFAQQHDVSRVVLKRELSEMSKHTLKMDVASLAALPGRGEEGGYRWMVQPLKTEFAAYPEMRMFVIGGRCRWGVATKVVIDKSGGTNVSLSAVAAGRRIWTEEGGQEAALLAEKIVALLRRHQAHAAHFLRVDMVRRHTDEGGGWWINELEFFGNAFIHFDVFDNASEMLDDIVHSTKCWLLELVSGH